jgi:hypothetical protein
LPKSGRLNADVEILAVAIGEPLLSSNQFRLHLDDDERYRSTGERTGTTKLSLYDATASRITREEGLLHPDASRA